MTCPGVKVRCPGVKLTCPGVNVTCPGVNVTCPGGKCDMSGGKKYICKHFGKRKKFGFPGVQAKYPFIEAFTYIL